MDPEDIMRKIDQLAEEFAESPSLALAEQLERLLSKFKIAVGIGVFDQLYSYSRLEAKVERYLNSLEANTDYSGEKLACSLKPQSLEDLFKTNDAKPDKNHW